MFHPSPPPTRPQLQPTAPHSFVRASNAGPRHIVQLSELASIDPEIERFAVCRVSLNTFRAVVLYVFPGRNGCMTSGCEGDRETVRQWLVNQGVPALKIGKPIPPL